METNMNETDQYGDKCSGKCAPGSTCDSTAGSSKKCSQELIKKAKSKSTCTAFGRYI